MIDVTALASQQRLIGAIAAYGFTPEAVDVIESVPSEGFTDPMMKKAFDLMVIACREGEKFDTYALATEGKLTPAEGGQIEILVSEAHNANVKVHARQILAAMNIRRILGMSERINHLVNHGSSHKAVFDEVIGTINGLELESKSSKTVTLSDVVKDYPSVLEDRMTFSGLSWGSDDMDKAGGRMRGGQVCILAGPPGTGKTEMAMRVARSVSFEQGKGVVIFSAEMSREELSDRFIAIEGNIPGGYLEQPALMNVEDNEHMWGKVSPAIVACKEKGGEVFIHDEANIPYSRITSVTKKCLAKTKNIGLIVVDYVQLIRDPNQNNRFEEVSEVSRRIKAIAKEFNLPVLLLAQLSREAVKALKSREPENSDLRESAQLEQDADKICFLWAPDKDEPGSPNKELVQAIFRKRRAGKPGRAVFQFANGHFYETDQGWVSSEHSQTEQQEPRKYKRN